MELPSDGVVSLSLFESHDAAVMMAADLDPEIRRRFEFPAEFVPSREHSLKVIARWARERSDGSRFTFAVRDSRSGTLVGGCEVKPHSRGAANLSCWTYPESRGRGLATRAAALACRFAFDDLGIQRLEVLVDPDNARSRRVALRNGFKAAGVREGRDLLTADAVDSGGGGAI